MSITDYLTRIIHDDIRWFSDNTGLGCFLCLCCPLARCVEDTRYCKDELPIRDALIYKQRQSGKSYKEIAEYFNLAKITIQVVVHKKKLEMEGHNAG